MAELNRGGLPEKIGGLLALVIFAPYMHLGCLSNSAAHLLKSGGQTRNGNTSIDGHGCSPYG
jgi:hypothetical protein